MKAITLISSLLVLFLANPLWAAETDELTQLTKNKIDQVINLLQKSNLDKPTRNAKIIEAIDPIFDFDQMAKLSLGKKYWSQMNEAQQAEFLKLFVVRLQESYLEKLDLYTNERVEVEEAQQVKSRVYVTTKLISGGEAMEMVYKFFKGRQGWQVYDVVILGVSVVQTYRSQFEGLMSKGNAEDLLNKMRKSGELKIPAAN
ncbi:MAG: ABC transporter substrate-binding protein [bacterium]|nr:ABC transporter substrate-binding protein [bacterium]